MTVVGRRCVFLALQFTLAIACLAAYPAAAHAQGCTQTLSPGNNVASAVSSAPGGAVICLNSGSYGTVTLSGISKNPRVTIRSASGQGASLRLVIQNGTNGITVDSVTVTSASFTGGSTRNITVRNSAFTGHLVIDGLANSNVLLEGNTHNNIQGGGQFSSPARIHLSYSGSQHSGVTIQGSLFDGGSADGIQTGTGVNIVGNEFRNIHEGSCGDCHTDAIQLLGAPDSVIRGNYFFNVATAIVAFDGVTRAVIEDNVIDTAGRPWGIELYADRSSVVRHNTLLYRPNCAFNLPCGAITLDRKSSDPPGSGTIVVDNIATSISTLNGSTVAERHHNLVRSGASAGDLSGSPTYVGGATPTSWAGFELAAGSRGKGAASSPPGSDIGATIAPSSSGPPQGTPPGPPSNVRVIE